MRRLFLGFLVATFGVTGIAFAADIDNDGFGPDVDNHEPGSYDGPLSIAGSTVVFPSLPADTWEVMFYPHWWNVGDTAYGVHDFALSPVDHADITLLLNRNGLSPGCGFIDVDFLIDGTVVGSFTITPEHGLGPVEASFDFAAVAPPFELRYTLTNTVIGGCGSVEFNETGDNFIAFSGPGTPVQKVSWSSLKQEHE